MQSFDDALEWQQQLLESSLLVVFEAYDQGAQQKVEQPVVILLDCEDPIGGEIARSWLGDAAVNDAVAEQAADRESDEHTTVFARAFSFAECRSEIPRVFDYLAPVFQDPPPEDGVLVISVTGGGASALTAPFSARPQK